MKTDSSPNALHIFSRGQNNQFTATVFTDVLKGASIDISMDGWSRAFDKISIGRLCAASSAKMRSAPLHDQIRAERRLGWGTARHRDMLRYVKLF